MKKVKTIVTSLLIFFATAFMSACSCGGQAPVDQVYETGITIKCLSENITNTLDEESGLLTISCHRGDEFVIEYTLTPSNATTTQVDWEFNKDGIVDSRTYTRSQSTVESITFNARSKGEVTLTFTTKGTGKKAYAKITVYEAKVALPTFASPENISYDPSKAEISWNPVNKVITSQNVLQDATLVGTGVLGLTGYEVSLTDLSNNTTTTTLVTSNKLGGIERGKSYSVVVRAIGDGFNVKTGEASVEFKYHQIATATGLVNNKGNISFVSPNHANENRIYYVNGDLSKFKPRSTTPGATSSFHYKEFDGYEMLDEFVVSVQSFPDKSKFDSTLGYSVGDDGIRYYPSIVTDSITIQKLKTPTLSLVNNKQDLTIDGFKFTNDNPDEKPNVSSIITWGLNGKVYEQNYGVKYAYEIRDNQNKLVANANTNDTYFDLKGLKAGVYTLNVNTIGNDSNTIPSSTVSISLTVLDKINNVYVAGGSTSEWSIVDNVLYVYPEYKIGGIELYFVNKDNPANSQKLYFSAYDNVLGYIIPEVNLSKIGLIAGNYDVYGRFVGTISDNGATMSATSDVNNSTDKLSFTVIDPVTSTRITSDGKIHFSNVSTASAYDIIVRQTSTSNPYIITIYTSTSSGVPTNSIYASEVVNGERVVSLYDIVRKIVATVQGVTDEEIERLINGYVHNNFVLSYEIIAKGNGSDTIDSSITSKVHFSRLQNISNLEYYHQVDNNGYIDENTNILAFSPVANANKYIVGIDGYTIGGESTIEVKLDNVISDQIQGYINNQSGKIEIDLSTIKLANSENETLGMYISKLVKENNAVSITFTVRAVGTAGNTTSQGNLDTVVSLVSYNVSSTPTNLRVDENKILTWDATNTQNEQYLIRYYLVNGETLSEIDSYRFVLNSAMSIEEEDSESDDEDGEEEEPEPEPVNPFRVDISSVLAENEGYTIAVSIEEINARRINGNASSKYYTIQLPKVVADYSTIGENTPVISWVATEGADYYDVEVTSQRLTEPINVTNITATYYAIPSDLVWDTYSISVVAKKNNDGANSPTNPYVIYSTPTIKKVTIASATIEARPEGTNVVWGDIGLGTEYKFEYKLTGESNYILVDDSLIVRDTIDTTKLMFDASELEAGEYSFKVTPSVDFTDKNGMAYIIRGTVQDNTIPRFQPADTLKTENGNITFQVYADPNITSLLPELYIEGGDGKYNKISSDEYSLTIDDSVDSCIKYILVLNNAASGDLKFKIKVVADGYLDSKLSDPLSARKLAAVTDFTKEGGWLSWTHQADVSTYSILYGLDPKTISELRIDIERYEKSDGSVGYKGIVDVVSESTTIRAELTSDKFKYENGKFYYLFDEVEFIKYGAGAYNFTIKPITTIAGVISGSISAPTIITKLNNEVAIGIENGEIAISPYVQLEGVTETPTFVSITVKGYTIKTEQVETGAGQGGEPTTKEVQTKEYAGTYSHEFPFVADETISIDLIKIGLSDAGTYEVTVVYLGNENLILDSAVKTESGLEKLQTTNLSTVDGEITWGAIETAEKYAIKVINPDSTEEIIQDLTVSDGIALLPKDAYTFELGKEYTLKIQAQGAEFINSEWSEGFKVRKLQAPTDLQVQAERNIVTGESGETTYVGEPFIKWTDPNGTKHKLNYVLTYNSANAPDILIHNTGAISYQLLDRTLPIGIYSLQLRVLGNSTTGTANTGLLSSDFSTGINANYIQDVTGVKVENGIIKWNAISGAYAYRVSIYDKTEYNNYLEELEAYAIEYAKYVEEYAKYEEDLAKYNAGELAEAPTIPTAPGLVTMIDAKYSTFVTETNCNILNSNMAVLNNYNGIYTIVINAYTDPSKAIVSRNLDIEQENTTKLYKPQVVEDYKVKNGMLSWTMPVANIVEFVEAFTQEVDESGNPLLNMGAYLESSDGQGGTTPIEPALAVLQYIADKINLGKDGDATLDEQLSFIYKIQLKINGTTIVDIADSVIFYNAQGVAINDKANYLNAKTLEFIYNVSIDPEDMEINDYEPPVVEDPEEDDGSEEDSNTPTEPTNSTLDDELYSSRVRSTTTNILKTTSSTVNNNASWYTIQIASIGNSDTVVPVISSGYTSKITAYKPMTPRTWLKDGSDIVNGNVLWELVTTEKSKMDVADYYKDYRVTAISTEYGKAYYDLTIDVNNISDEYKYSEHLKNMFVTEGGTTNFVYYNTFYTVMVNTLGTKDSTLLTDKETIYLNSNPFKFANAANILSAANPKVENSSLEWTPSYGSTATKLFVYGPFDNLEEDKKTYNEEWRDDVDLSQETPRIITLADEGGPRDSYYTLTDALYNNDAYEAGSYIIKTQEIGDGKGVVDSVISNDNIGDELRVIKLGKTAPIEAQKDAEYPWLGYSDNKAGMFVWSEVPLANAYKVSIYKGAEKNGQYEHMLDEIVTDTYYDLPSDNNLINDGYYYIEISACHVDDSLQLSPNYFTGDKVTTTSHERVTVPNELVVGADGLISWNDGTQYTNIGHYEVRYNANPSNAQKIVPTNGLSQNIPVMDLNLGNAKGTISIQVRGVAVTGNGYLNSSYSSKVVITKLADPNPRVKNGVFMWGTEGDGVSEGSVTPSELIINSGAKQVLENQITQLTYFTELETYDSSYRANRDTAQYPVGSHEFKVRFQGTSGNTNTHIGEFYLASNQLIFNASKLATPVLENVVLEVNGDADNRVKWSSVTGATDYKVIIFAGEERQVFNLSNPKHKTYFEEIKDGDDVIGYYFKLNDIIASFESSIDGITLNIHCQALGTINSADVESGETIYLNSSYSDVAIITVPPMPSDINYVTDEGKVTWSIDTESGFNIMLTTNYKVVTVTAEEFESYWKLSADAIGENDGIVLANPDKSLTPYSEIKYRKMIYTIVSEGIYSLDITDTIMLIAKDGITPTSYTLTSVGSYYYFSVTATIGDETYDGVFKSVTNTLINTDENGNPTNVPISSFDLFSDGDGSYHLPYVIENQNHLNRIRYFKDRHFVILPNNESKTIQLDTGITGSSYTWDIITGQFTGSIDGNNSTIKNITTQTINVSGTTYLSFMEDNSGIIKNLNLEINYSNSVLSSTKLNVAGLAITNNGLISNVNIEGTININAGRVTSGIMAGGLVVVNEQNASIENSIVSANITALDNGSYSTYTGGIACTNYGAVSESSYTGVLTSNYIGGIIASNYGTIDKCSVTATLNSTDRPASSDINTRKGSIVGGIVAETFNNSSITNSYSTATITITKDSSTGKSTFVGGIVGDLSANAFATIENCYVVVDFNYLSNITDSSVTINYVVESGINNGSYIGAINNYYLIADSNQITTNVVVTGVTEANNLTDLQNKVSTLKDGEGNLIYDISNASGYPVFRNA